jgi:hypothetical protein
MAENNIKENCETRWEQNHSPRKKEKRDQNMSIRLNNAVSPAGETVYLTSLSHSQYMGHGLLKRQIDLITFHLFIIRRSKSWVSFVPLRHISSWHYCRFEAWFLEILSSDVPFVSCQLSYIIKWLRSDYTVHFRLVFGRKRIFRVICNANVDPSTQVWKNVMLVVL